MFKNKRNLMKKLYYLFILTLLSARGIFAASSSSASCAAAAAAATSNSSSKAAAVTKEKAAAQATLQPGESNATHTCWNVELYVDNSPLKDGPHKILFPQSQKTQTTLEKRFPGYTIESFSFVHIRKACVVNVLKK
jgi:hypothetical protein